MEFWTDTFLKEFIYKMDMNKSLKDLKFKEVKNMSSKIVILLIILGILVVGGLGLGLFMNDLKQELSPLTDVNGIETNSTVNGENVTNVVNETTGTNLTVTIHKDTSMTYNGKTVVNGTTKVYDNYTISLDGKKTGSVS
jgi:flagellar basal body-associated protein FliL